MSGCNNLDKSLDVIVKQCVEQNLSCEKLGKVIVSLVMNFKDFIRECNQGKENMKQKDHRNPESN